MKFVTIIRFEKIHYKFNLNKTEKQGFHSLTSVLFLAENLKFYLDLVDFSAYFVLWIRIIKLSG